jgi:hypothetical protein
MSFLTVLEKIGHGIVSVFQKAEPVINLAQAVATPFEGPVLSAAINLTLNKIYAAEAIGVATAAKGNSGSAKLAFVASSIAPEVGPILAQLGVKSVSSTQYTDFVNHLVAALNVFTTEVETPAIQVPATPITPVTGAALSGK